MTTKILTPIADVYIREPNPTTPYGGETSLIIGVDATPQRTNSLIKFDLGEIPKGAKINSVTLSLYQTYRYNTGLNVNIRRMLRDWVEATATWRTYDGTHSWDSYGADGAADRDTEIIGSFVNGSTNNIWYTATISLAAFHIMREEDYGFHLQIDTVPSVLVQASYSAREAGSHEPRLTVDYDALLDPVII